MKLFRTVRNIYSSHKFSRKSAPESSGCGDRLRFETKLKIGDKYEKRSIEFSSGSEVILHVIKNADYMTIDSFNLSETFVTQLFDAKDSKCTIVLIEGIITFKMANLSDKWRFVEFLRANVEIRALSTDCYLETCPLAPKEQLDLPVRIFFKDSTIVIQDLTSKSILAHTSLEKFDLLVCKSDKMSFVCRNSEAFSEFWSLRIENGDKLAAEIENAKALRRLPFTFTREREQAKYVPMPYTDI